MMDIKPLGGKGLIATLSGVCDLFLKSQISRKENETDFFKQAALQ